MVLVPMMYTSWIRCTKWFGIFVGISFYYVENNHLFELFTNYLINRSDISAVLFVLEYPPITGIFAFATVSISLI